MSTSPSTRQLDAALTALADPTRRSILRRLMGGEVRVTDVARRYPMSLNAISKHVRTLERAGLVRRRRVGREHWLSFRAAPLDRVSAWIEVQRAFWTTRLDALDAMLDTEGRDLARKKGTKQ